MRVPTTAGQYRRVRYSDDGCSIYACCWCDRTIEIRDDPQYSWNFCPKCGKSWFHRLECRERTTPRWYYERFWGKKCEPTGKVKLANGKEMSITDLIYACYRSPEYKANWVFECRTKWRGDPWGEWKHKMTDRHDMYHNYLWAKSMLGIFRNQHDDDNSPQFEFCAKLVRN